MSHACPPASSDVEQAAWWLAQQHSGEPWTPAQQQALEQWLATHPTRSVAYARMQQMWGDFEPAAAPAARTALQAGAQAAAQRRSSLRSTGKRVVQGTTTLALLAGLVWLGWQHEQVQYWAADHRSGKGEIITIDLPDHSQITLGSNSAVNVHYGSQERRIELLRGDLLAHVAHLPDSQAQTRPFVVETANATAQAMGTVYSVRYRPNSETALWPAQGASTLIAVQESSVRACLSEAAENNTANTTVGTTADTTASCHTVQAGQFTRIDAQGLHPLESTAPGGAIGDAPAWARGQLLVNNLPLPQVLHELERHRPGWLLFDAQALADIRVSGVFDLIDTERSLRALQESTDVYFQSAAPWITQAQRRSPADASERPARTP